MRWVLFGFVLGLWCGFVFGLIWIELVGLWVCGLGVGVWVVCFGYVGWLCGVVLVCLGFCGWDLCFWYVVWVYVVCYCLSWFVMDSIVVLCFFVFRYYKVGGFGGLGLV